MATIHSLAEANKLTIPALLRGVLEVIRKRGLPDFYAMLVFKQFEGSTYDFNWELTNASGSSVVDPYSTGDLVEGVGTRTRVNVVTKALGRNVDTAKIDMVGKSNINNIRAQDIRDAAKTFAFDFADEAIRGMGYNNHCNGLDYWVDYWAANGFATQDFNAAGATFSSSLLYDMLLRTKMESFDAIFADRQTTVEFMALLSELPGNVPMHIMDPRFDGRPVLGFNGVPWITLDVLSEDKVATSAVVAGTGTTITPATTDNGFPGFSQADVGKTVSDGSNTSTISSVNFSTGVATISGSITDGTKTITVRGADTSGAATDRRIYAVRFDEGDGFTALYHNNPDGPSPDTGEYQGTSIAGFSARDLGELQGPNIRRARMDWFGNFAAHSPFSVVRMRNFAFPS